MLTFRGPGNSDDWYRSTMQVIVIGLGTSLRARANFGCTGNRLGATATRVGVPGTSLGAPQITVQQSGKNDIFFGNAAGGLANYTYYILLNNFKISWLQCVFSNMYLYSYPSTHDISGLTAGGVSEQSQICQTITIQ